MREEGTWQGTLIMGQQGVWIHYDGMIIMFSLHNVYDGGMMRQQRSLLLRRIGREQGQNFYPTWHSVARVKYGTIMVQEVFSSWRRPLIFGSIMENTFEKLHVKGWSYILAGDCLHESTTLLLHGMDLLKECPFELSTFEALEGQYEGENFVFACVDYLTQYLHILSISM